MGMHLGAVVERGDDFVGQTVNIAARVADLAGPGELLVTEQVVRSLSDSGNGGVGAFRAIGPTRVKGVGEPIWLHRLVT
jgi:class 3 adenylate cyclase